MTRRRGWWLLALLQAGAISADFGEREGGLDKLKDDLSMSEVLAFARAADERSTRAITALSARVEALEHAPQTTNGAPTMPPTDAPTMSPTYNESCLAAREIELTRFGPAENEFQLLGPPGITTPCADVLAAMQDGKWSYDMAHICDSPDPMLNTLCESPNKTMGEEGYDDFDNDMRATTKPSAWRPNKCTLKIFTPSQVCTILRKAGDVYITGESLQRHTYQGVLNILSGDYDFGSVQCDDGVMSGGVGYQSALCRGERQYSEHEACSAKRRNGLVPGCDKTKELVHYFELYQVSTWQIGRALDVPEFEHFAETDSQGHKVIEGCYDWQKVLRSMNKEGLFLWGLGINDAARSGLPLNSSLTTAEVAEPLMKYLKTLPEDQRPHVVYQAMHAGGHLKPEQFVKTQGNEAVLGYNKGMAATAERLGFPVFDAFKISEGAHSYDGLHYGLTFSVYRAQLIMNYLYQLQNTA
jgi:hypothetical protein